MTFFDVGTFYNEILGKIKYIILNFLISKMLNFYQIWGRKLNKKQKQRHINKLIKKFIKKGLKYNYKKSNFEKAIQMFDKAIELNPNNPNAYKYRGDVYMITNAEKAIQDYVKAVELKPNYISAYYSRAIISSCPFCDVPLSKAIEDYLTIINYNKNFFEAYQSLGELLSANKYYEWADLMFTKSIELKPKDFMYYMKRGENYIELQKYEKAIKDFNTALEIYNKYYVGFNMKYWAYTSLGRTYNLLKDYNKVIDFYTKAIEVVPNNLYDRLINVYKVRGEAYLQVGDKEKADIDLKLMKEVEQAMGD